jgi:hypothetical protein
VHHRIVSAVKRVQFVSDRVSYVIMRGRWCNNIVLHVHKPSEGKSDESKEALLNVCAKFDGRLVKRFRFTHLYLRQVKIEVV